MPEIPVKYEWTEGVSPSFGPDPGPEQIPSPPAQPRSGPAPAAAPIPPQKANLSGANREGSRTLAAAKAFLSAVQADTAAFLHGLGRQFKQRPRTGSPEAT